MRRFTLRAFSGAAFGAVAGAGGIYFLPEADVAGGFLTGLGFEGLHWLWPLAIPPLAGVVAYVATRSAAFRRLKEQS